MLKSYHAKGLDLGKLLVFQAVAEELSFRRAAERLGQAQPAVSRQVKSLEAALDCRLFERDTSGTRLTAAGEELLAGLPAVFEDLVRVFERSRLAGLGQRGRLRIGCPVAAINTYLPSIFGRYREDHPGVALEMMEKSSAGLLGEVASGKLDCCFLLSVEDLPPSGLQWRTLFREEVGVVLPRNYGLSGERKIDPESLRDLPYLSFSRVANPPFHDLLRSYFEASGVRVSESETIASRLQAIGRVGAGMGFTTLTASLAYICGEATVFRQLSGAEVPRVHHRLVWRDDSANPALQSFLRRVASETFDRWMKPLERLDS